MFSHGIPSIRSVAGIARRTRYRATTRGSIAIGVHLEGVDYPVSVGEGFGGVLDVFFAGGCEGGTFRVVSPDGAGPDTCAFNVSEILLEREKRIGLEKHTAKRRVKDDLLVVEESIHIATRPRWETGGWSSPA